MISDKYCSTVSEMVGNYNENVMESSDKCSTGNLVEDEYKCIVIGNMPNEGKNRCLEQDRTTCNTATESELFPKTEQINKLHKTPASCYFQQLSTSPFSITSSLPLSGYKTVKSKDQSLSQSEIYNYECKEYKIPMRIKISTSLPELNFKEYLYSMLIESLELLPNKRLSVWSHLTNNLIKADEALDIPEPIQKVSSLAAIEAAPLICETELSTNTDDANVSKEHNTLEENKLNHFPLKKSISSYSFTNNVPDIRDKSQKLKSEQDIKDLTVDNPAINTHMNYVSETNPHEKQIYKENSDCLKSKEKLKALRNIYFGNKNTKPTFNSVFSTGTEKHLNDNERVPVTGDFRKVLPIENSNMDTGSNSLKFICKQKKSIPVLKNHSVETVQCKGLHNISSNISEIMSTNSSKLSNRQLFCTAFNEQRRHSFVVQDHFNKMTQYDKMQNSSYINKKSLTKENFKEKGRLMSGTINSNSKTLSSASKDNVGINNTRKVQSLKQFTTKENYQKFPLPKSFGSNNSKRIKSAPKDQTAHMFHSDNNRTSLNQSGAVFSSEHSNKIQKSNIYNDKETMSISKYYSVKKIQPRMNACLSNNIISKIPATDTKKVTTRNSFGCAQKPQQLISSKNPKTNCTTNKSEPYADGKKLSLKKSSSASQSPYSLTTDKYKTSEKMMLNESLSSTKKEHENIKNYAFTMKNQLTRIPRKISEKSLPKFSANINESPHYTRKECVKSISTVSAVMKDVTYNAKKSFSNEQKATVVTPTSMKSSLHKVLHSSAPLNSKEINAEMIQTNKTNEVSSGNFANIKGTEKDVGSSMKYEGFAKHILSETIMLNDSELSSVPVPRSFSATEVPKLAQDRRNDLSNIRRKIALKSIEINKEKIDECYTLLRHHLQNMSELQQELAKFVIEMYHEKEWMKQLHDGEIKHCKEHFNRYFYLSARKFKK